MWLGILGLYLAGWGEGLVRAGVALVDLFHGKPLPDHRPVPSIDATVHGLVSVGVDLAIAVVAIGAIVLIRPVGERFDARIFFRSIPLTTAAIIFGWTAVDVVAAYFPRNGYPAVPIGADGLTLLREYGGSFAAGPAEEFVLLGLVLVGLRFVGLRWINVLIAAVVLRVLFHAYYGVPALGLVVWAGLMVLLARRFGIWVLPAAAFAHSVWDLLQSWTGAAPKADREWPELVNGLWVLGSLVYLGLELVAWGVRVRKRRRAVGTQSASG